MGMTNDGFSLKRFQQISEEFETTIQDSFDQEVDLSSNAILGVLTSIFIRAEADVWELAQGVNDTVGIRSSEEGALDNNCLIVGIVRFPATHTRGDVWVNAEGGTVIENQEVFLSVNDDKFKADREVIITPSKCRELWLLVNTLVPEEDYVVVVSGNSFVYTSDTTPTYSEILLGLQDELLLEGDLDVTYIQDEDDSKSYLLIQRISDSNMAVASTTFLSFDHITSEVPVTADSTGAVEAQKGTITRLEEEDEGVYYLANPDNLRKGRKVESDAELLFRTLTAYNEVAGGTPDSVHEGIFEVQGVDDVKVTENRTLLTVDNVPPKALRVIVNGGDDFEVGEAIWENKAAGVHTWTDRNDERSVVVEIEDYNEQLHFVQYTRPEIIYVWARVEYTRYLEENLSTNVEEIIQESIVNTGDRLSIGDDLVPKKFIGPIYRSVDGLEDVTVYMAITTDLVEPSLGSYQEDRLDIAEDQVTNFATSRVTVFDIT